MKLFGRRSLNKSLLVASFLALCIPALAQKSGVIPSSGRVISSKPINMDTRSFFPQIMASVSPQPREVKNPSLVQKFGFGTPNGLTAGGMGTEASSVLGANFPGISFTGWIPADPQIAVSATHIVQVVNTKIAFFNKSGVKSFERELGSSGFFTGIATTATFDPKVFYDKFTDRFVVVTLEQDGTNSQFCIAVSDTGNPNGNWKKYKLDNKGTVGSNTFWLDYEGWGHNKDAVVATGNMFPFGSGNPGGSWH